MSQYGYATNNELFHHGIKGQKWGVRRYQNEDGSLTPEGRKRYGYDVLKDKKAVNALYKNNGYVYNELKKGIKNRVDDYIEEFNGLRKTARDSEEKDLDEHFINDPNTKKRFMNYMNSTISPDAIDDEELPLYVAQEWFDSEFNSARTDNTRELWNEYQNFANDGSIMKKYIDDILGEYKNYSPSILKGPSSAKVKSMVSTILDEADKENVKYLRSIEEPGNDKYTALGKQWVNEWKVQNKNRKAAERGNQLAKKSNFDMKRAADSIIDKNLYEYDDKFFSWEDAEEYLLKNYKGYWGMSTDKQSDLMSSLIQELKNKGCTLID